MVGWISKQGSGFVFAAGGTLANLNLWYDRRVFEPDSPRSRSWRCSRVSLVRMNCVDDTSLLSVYGIQQLRDHRQPDLFGSARRVKVSVRGGLLGRLWAWSTTKDLTFLGIRDHIILELHPAFIGVGGAFRRLAHEKLDHRM